MERTKETLEARVRETPLGDRLKECQKRIGNMCAELRGPKMSIPVEYYDDDFYICTTLADAQATVEALQAQLKTARYDAVRAFVRGEDKMCFVCGAKEPCELKDDPSSPCTFDPTPMELKQQVEALQRVRDEFERERDQLHAALMEAKAALADAEREKVKGLHEITKVICTHCCEPMEIPSKAVLQTQLSQLQDWRDQVTLALQRAGGARFEDVPGHVKTVVDDLTQLQALVRAKEDVYEKILLSRERLEREMRGYPPVDNEGIPMVWQEPVGWVKRHPGRHDAMTPVCQICNGANGVPGNENIVNGVVMCDYCHAKGGNGE